MLKWLKLIPKSGIGPFCNEIKCARGFSGKWPSPPLWRQWPAHCRRGLAPHARCRGPGRIRSCHRRSPAPALLSPLLFLPKFRIETSPCFRALTSAVPTSSPTISRLLEFPGTSRRRPLLRRILLYLPGQGIEAGGWGSSPPTDSSSPPSAVPEHDSRHPRRPPAPPGGLPRSG